MSRPKFRFLASIFLAVGFAGVAAAQENQAKIKVLIVTGFDAGAHKWRDTTQQTTAILEGAGKFDVKVSEDIGIFESSSLGGYDVVVLNYGFWNQPEPSDEAKEALLNYVKSGKGLVSVHFSCSSFQEWDEYRELLGRVWVKGTGGHGPRGEFSVKIDKPEHPITAGLSEFTVDDELYAKLSGDAEIEVLASAYSDWSKKVEPIVFVKPYGKGRVVHNVLGHDTRARENPTFQTLLVRGVEWAATGKAATK
jgi:type 1 glutamine amidotransferase